MKTLKKKWSTTTKSLKKEKTSLRLIKSKTERNLPVSYNSLGICLSSWVRSHSSFLTADYVFTADVGGGRDVLYIYMFYIYIALINLGIKNWIHDTIQFMAYHHNFVKYHLYFILIYTIFPIIHHWFGVTNNVFSIQLLHMYWDTSLYLKALWCCFIYFKYIYKWYFPFKIIEQ